MSSEQTRNDGPPARGAAMRPSIGDEHPVREMLRIALPAVVTMMSYVVMQFVDMLIVSRLGADALSAVGNGGIAAFVMAAMVFGSSRTSHGPTMKVSPLTTSGAPEISPWCLIAG